MLHDDGGGVARLLQCVAREVAQRLVVHAEAAIPAGGGPGLVARVAAERRVATGQRQGLVHRPRGHVAHGSGDDAVVAAPAEHQRLAVPARRQVDLELDRRRGRVHRPDVAQRAAEGRERRRAGAGRGNHCCIRHDRAARRQSDRRGGDLKALQIGARRRRGGRIREAM